jgi:hypothetical protein
VRVGGSDVEAQANACGPRIVAGRASTVVVTIRETMARTRGRIALMRVCGGRRMSMAWARVELERESVVAKLEREVVVCLQERSRDPTGLVAEEALTCTASPWSRWRAAKAKALY